MVWATFSAPGRSFGSRLVRLDARLGFAWMLAWLAWVRLSAGLARLGAGLARLGEPGLDPLRCVARWSCAKRPRRAGVASWAGSLAHGLTTVGLGRGNLADQNGGRR